MLPSVFLTNWTVLTQGKLNITCLDMWIAIQFMKYPLQHVGYFLFDNCFFFKQGRVGVSVIIIIFLIFIFHLQRETILRRNLSVKFISVSLFGTFHTVLQSFFMINSMSFFSTIEKWQEITFHSWKEADNLCIGSKQKLLDKQTSKK